MKSIVNHTFKEYFNSDSKTLILGSIPSKKSRELGFYYMHPQNRFWVVLSKVFNEEIGSSIEAKKEFLKRHKIALWDVIDTCEIDGARDSSIKNVKVNDINKIIKNSNINRIFTAGKKADELYNKYCLKDTKVKSICLYSTSPANCAISLDRIVENYKIINNESI